MNRWTVQDEINLQRWVEAKGFRIVYLPEFEEYGFVHMSKPHEINGGFKRLVDLKQYFVNLKGENKNVQIVSEGEFHKAVEDARRVRKLH